MVEMIVQDLIQVLISKMFIYIYFTLYEHTKKAEFAFFSSFAEV